MQQELLLQMPYSLAVRYLGEVLAVTLRRLLKEDPALQQERKSNQHPLRRRAQFGKLIQLDGSPRLTRIVNSFV